MASIVNAKLDADGKVTVTYNDGSTRRISQDQAKKEGITVGGTPTPTPSSGNTLFFPSSGSSGDTGNTVTDPQTGQTVSATLIIPTKQGNKTISELLIAARDPAKLGKIRTELINNGIISKGTRAISSIQSAYVQVLIGSATSKMDPSDYMVAAKKAGFGQDIAASGPSTNIYPTIKSATDLASDVTKSFQSVFNRDPSAQEIAQYSADIASQLKKKENQPTVRYVTKNGVNTQETTTGLDVIQYLTDKLKATPEYAKLKEAGTISATQKVAELAKKNGIVLSGTDLAGYAERVRNGEPLDNIGATFRQIAGISQPKNIQDLLNKGVDLATIYQPYKSAMAQTLELNPDTIELNDPALAGAITGDKTMTSYEFQNSLRKDPRWQYTANAHDTVSSAVQQVLKDFGFMG